VKTMAAASAAKTAFQRLVGNTRLVRLEGPSKLTGCNILGKCEYENPGGSVKDRAGLWMVNSGIERGELVEGEAGIIVEGTAGNTGIGLALAGGCFGFRSIICLASSQSQEKKDTLRWAGAELLEVPAVPYADPNNYVHVAKRVADTMREKGHRVMYANQWDNLANRQAHIDATGPEIWRQTEGKIDAFSCAMGTGGTLTGVAESLRELSDRRVKIALTDPPGAKLFRYYTTGKLEAEGSSITEGIGQGRITGNMKGFLPDMAYEIHDNDALKALWDVHANEGLALGGSSGTNIAGAIRVAKELGPGHTIVTILCDLGSRYASRLYNREFLESKQLPLPPWLTSECDDAVRADAEAALEMAYRT